MSIMKARIVIIIILIMTFTCFASLDLLENLIRFHINSGNLDKALENIEKGLRMEPENEKFIDLKNKVLDMMEKQSSKDDKKDKNVSGEKDREDDKNILEQVDVDEILPEKKLKPFKFFSELEKSKIKSLNDEGIKLKSLDKNTEAKAKFEEVLKYDELDTTANFYLGTILYNEHKYDDALERFKKVITYDPENSQALYWLARTYGKKKEYDVAASLYKKVIDINPKSVMAYAQLASIYQARKNIRQAEKYYRDALKVDSRLITVYMSLAELYLNYRLYSKAMEVYKEMVKIYPKNPYSYTGLAYVYFELEEFDNTWKMYALGEKLSPDNPEVLALKAVGFFYQKDFAKAEEAAEKAIQRASNNQKIYRMITKTLYINNEKQTMMKYARKGLIYFPSDPYLNYYMGIANFDLNELEKAMTHLQRTLVYWDTDREVIHKLAQIYSKLKYYTASLELYKRLIDEFSEDKNVENWKREAQSVYSQYKDYKEVEVPVPDQQNFEQEYEYQPPAGF